MIWVNALAFRCRSFLEIGNCPCILSRSQQSRVRLISRSAKKPTSTLHDVQSRLSSPLFGYCHSSRAAIRFPKGKHCSFSTSLHMPTQLLMESNIAANDEAAEGSITQLTATPTQQSGTRTLKTLYWYFEVAKVHDTAGPFLAERLTNDVVFLVASHAHVHDHRGC
jgi:hypothetical protein